MAKTAMIKDMAVELKLGKKKKKKKKKKKNFIKNLKKINNIKKKFFN